MEKQLILGTAGHIDHGKSALVRALTGTDPDRLAEEKRRGITIELGFAELALGNYHFGIVDVPGHEKFVRMMVAGATGIDLVMLVIAADEGVMPQTREHLDICTLLGIKHGFIALTKVDLVDEDWLELVKEDIRASLRGSFLEEAELVPVSSKTGEGLERLKRVLIKLAEETSSKERRGLARLPIDRVFEQKGFGPVVTGTLGAGLLKVGDSISLLPDGFEGRIRGLQVHGKPVEEAVAGQRTAVNIQGIDLHDIHRGQVLIKGQSLKPTQEVTAKVRLLKHLPKPIKHRAPMLMHAGTVQIPCRIWLYEEKNLPPATEAYARFLLEQPTILLPGDSFILRGFQRFEGYGTTIGGGTILDPFPPRRKRGPRYLKRLAVLDEGEPIDVITLLAEEAATQGISREQLQQQVNITEKELQRLISKLLNQGILIQFERDPIRYIHKSNLEFLFQQLEEKLSTYHAEHPLDEGMGREELREQLSINSPKLFNILLQRMEKKGILVISKEYVKLATHRVRLKELEEKVEKKLIALYEEAGLTPPRARDLPKLTGFNGEDITPVLELLARRGTLVRIVEDLYFSKRAIDALQEQLVAFLLENRTIDAQNFKKLTQASRKFTIPLAEYFDKQKITHRVGDSRQLRKDFLMKYQSSPSSS